MQSSSDNIIIIVCKYSKSVKCANYGASCVRKQKIHGLSCRASTAYLGRKTAESVAPLVCGPNDRRRLRVASILHFHR